MTKYLLAFGLIVLTTLSCAAKDKISATGILDNSVKAFDSAKSINMTMSIRSGSDAFEARLLMSKEKFRYVAGALTVFYDGKTQWTVDNETKEVSITQPTADEIAETNPLAFVKSYKTKYKVNLVSESGGTYSVRLEAINKTSYVRSALVIISATTWLPTHITATLANGQNLTISVTNTLTNGSLPESPFKYNSTSYPGYEVFDLR